MIMVTSVIWAGRWMLACLSADQLTAEFRMQALRQAQREGVAERLAPLSEVLEVRASRLIRRCVVCPARRRLLPAGWP